MAKGCANLLCHPHPGTRIRVTETAGFSESNKSVSVGYSETGE